MSDLHSPRLDILPMLHRQAWAELVVRVQVRAEAQDYLDIDALIEHARIDLAMMLAAGRAIYGAAFNPQITLKALSYFEDGTVKELPDAVKQRLWLAVQAVDLDRLPVLSDARP